MLRILVSIIIGIISGIIGGALGIGGTVFMLPLLLLTNIIPDYKTIVGTLLFSLLPPISLLAVIEFGKRRQIDYLISSLLFITYFFGAYYGAHINDKYSNYWRWGPVGLTFAINFFNSKRYKNRNVSNITIDIYEKRKKYTR